MRRLTMAFERIRARQEWGFFGALWRTSPALAAAWWAALLARAVVPPAFAIGTGWLVRAVERDDAVAGPLVLVGVVFVVLQVLPPAHQFASAALGSRLSAALHERLMAACLAPAGIGHLERPELADDLTTARDFDLGMTGPPLTIGMDFIAGSMSTLFAGIAGTIVLFGFSWWAPPVLLIAWGSTHWLLRESGVWRDRQTPEVRRAQRHTDYAYRLAVDPPAAKEVRLFGLAPWLIARFAAARGELHELRWQATRLRERSVLRCLVIVLAANGAVMWAIADAAADGRLDLARVVVFAQATFGASAIAFGGLNWAMDGAAAPVAAVGRLERAMHDAGQLDVGRLDADVRAQPLPVEAGAVQGLPARELRFRDVTFAYPSAPDRPVLDGFDLTIPAGTSLAIVGQNGAGKTTLAKLLCRLYDPTGGAIEVDGIDLRRIDPDDWHRRVAAVFQDFVRYELTLRDNVAGGRATLQDATLADARLADAALDDETITAALREAGAEQLAGLDTPLARGYPGGTDLSGGQWQRVALARALAAVRSGAGVVLLDEPTAMLDVRGESEIFERVLAATRHCTTILVSHRFSTVRLADRICVVEHGRVVELGTHDELMSLGGRYRTMYELQASRFAELDDEGEEMAYEHL